MPPPRGTPSRSGSAARSQVKVRARRAPRSPSALARSGSPSSPLIAAAMASGSVGSTNTTASPPTSSVDVAGRGDHRRALGHGLEHGQAEALTQARIAEDRPRRRRAGRAHRAGRSRSPAPAIAPARATRRGPRSSPAGRPARARCRDSTSAKARNRVGQVLPRFDRAGPEHERSLEPVLGTSGRDLGLVDRFDVDAPRHDRERVRRRCRARCNRRPWPAMEPGQGGVATGQLEGALEEPKPVAGEVRRVVQEREVVHGHDERHATGRHRPAGGVDHVDGPGGAFHLRAARVVPRLVERGPRQRQHLDRDRRASTRSGGGWRWRAATPISSMSVKVGSARADSIAERAVPPGTECQHCSSVNATRRPSPTAGESPTQAIDRVAWHSGDGAAGDGVARIQIGRLADHDRG